MTLKAAFATINSANIPTISLHSFGVARTVFQMVALSNSPALGILLEVQLRSLDLVVLGSALYVLDKVQLGLTTLFVIQILSCFNT
jgi:hypothetical protein